MGVEFEGHRSPWSRLTSCRLLPAVFIWLFVSTEQHQNSTQHLTDQHSLLFTSTSGGPFCSLDALMSRIVTQISLRHTIWRTGWHRGVVCVVFVCRENTVSAGCVPFSVIYLINFSIQHVPTILQSSFKTHHNTYTIYKYIYILYKRQSIPFFSVLLSYEARFLSLTERVLHLHNRSTHLYQHFNFPGCGLLWLRPQHFSDWLQVIRIITNQHWRGKSTCDRAVICVWYLRAYEVRQ